jgi:hypothetical protein
MKAMHRTWTSVALFIALMWIGGCTAPSERLGFPAVAVERSARGIFYDVHGRGRADFALLRDERGKLDVLAYDDEGAGHFNREYRLSEYGNDDVPHLIILLDSIPFQKFLDAYNGGRLAWFDRPQKVIAPFPTMTELIYTKMLHGPPLPGMIDQYYNPDTLRIQDDLFDRVFHDHRESWERRVHYCASMYDSGLAYLNPRPWLAAELAIAKKTLDRSPDRVTIVYFSSASAMLSRYGEPGMNEVVDGIERLCMRVLYDRQGAIKISMCADHGHNLMESKNVDLATSLKAAGFHPGNAIKDPCDVVLEINGLVTYAAVRTIRPAAVASALVADKRIELATYMEGQRVMVCSSQGVAAIESRNRRIRYVPIDADVLGYGPVIEKLKAAGKIDADGFVDDDVWFAATIDHEYPDAPRRLWDAFHGTVVHTPEVMVVLRDGYCAGNPFFENYIHMASTHGGLNQVNSATFVMTMTGRAKGPMKSKDLLGIIEPGYEPTVRPER